MSKQRIARYTLSGLGYALWSPGNKGLPEFWFSTLEDVREFAENVGWKLKRI